MISIWYLTDVIRNVEGSNNFWIGLSDPNKSDDWSWIDSSQLSYVNWATGEPDNSNGEDICACVSTMAK